MERRNLLAVSSLAIPAALVAACAADGTPMPETQRVFAQIQFMLPLVNALAVGLAVAVPGAAPILAGVGPLLTLAADEFQKFTTTMSTTAALPIVQKVAAYGGQAFDLVEAELRKLPPDARAASFLPLAAQAREVFGLLLAFGTGVQNLPRGPGVAVRLLHK